MPDSKLNKTARNIFYLLFLLAILGITLGIVISYHIQTTSTRTKLQEKEIYSLQIEQDIISDFFNTAVSDLLFLSQLSSLQNYLDKKGSLQTITNDLVAFSISSRFYDQVRILDEKGTEIIRVDHNGTTASSPPASQLQNKANRYYFPATFRLNKQEIYVSPLDLNIEYGKIEIPHKPMLRFSSPIFDSAGNRRGILVLNYLAQSILDKLEWASPNFSGNLALINAEGYWLYSSIPNMAWGFMLPERADKNFSKLHPEAWQNILHNTNGQIITPYGLFTYICLNPIKNKTDINAQIAHAPQLYWTLVSHIPTEKLAAMDRQTLMRLILLGSFALFLSGIITWNAAIIIARRQERQLLLQEKANRDPLTKLANRELFTERLNSAYEKAESEGKRFALLYVDLDDFKNVNDTYGHTTGDLLLCQVADVLQQTCRQSDTVARLGGDEFAIILTQIRSTKAAQTVAAKILSALNTTFSLGSHNVRVSASIGAAIYPDECHSLNDILDNADKAMYHAKQKGKGRFTQFSELPDTQ